jgi:hypothetical protein
MGPRPRAPAQYPPSATNVSGHELGETARRELLAFPAEYLSDLPIPVTVGLVGARLGTGTVVLMCRRVCRRLSETEPDAPLALAAEIVFDAEELRAIAVGVQSERLRPADFAAFCLRKRVEPGFRVTEEDALDGACAERMPPGRNPWSLDRVLRWLELDLAALKYSGPEPVVQHAARAA